MDRHGLPLVVGRFVGGHLVIGPGGERNWVGYSTFLAPGDVHLPGGNDALLALIRDAGFTPALPKATAPAP